MIFGKWDERTAPRSDPRNAMGAANSLSDSKKVVIAEQPSE
jgi:hypothetical protein